MRWTAMLGAARLQPMHAAADPMDLQGLSAEAFVQRLGGSVEHAPWVAARAWAARPFADLDALAVAMRSAILGATRDEQLALLRGHPELAGREASEGTLTAESTGEQARLGLLALSAQQHAQLRELNREYRERFGFPLIIALRLHPTLESVFAEGRRRLRQPLEAERDAALQQVCEVMRGRLERLFAPPSPSPADRKDMP